MMRKKKIFTPIIAVGLAINLSVGSDLDIDIHTTQIENFYVRQFSDGATCIDRYFYAPQNGSEELLDSFKLSFANRPTANQLTLQKTGNGSGTLALGGANSVNFTSGAGVWINEFSIDFARSDITSSKQISLIFGNGNISSLSPSNSGRTIFNILNGYNRNDTLEVLFTGSTNSDFTINSSSTNTITFSKDGRGTIENIGDITISGGNSKNIFNFEESTYQGTFTNAISTDTQINFNGSNTQFIGDINTTGGTTTINFLTSGATFQGNINANGGNNIVNISPNINIASNLSFNRNSNSQGENLVNIDNGASLSSVSSNTGTTKVLFQGSSGALSRVDNAQVNFEQNGVFDIKYLDGNTILNVDKEITVKNRIENSNSILKIDNGASLRIGESELAHIISWDGNSTISFTGASGKLFFESISSGDVSVAFNGITSITFAQDGVFSLAGRIDGWGVYDKTSSSLGHIIRFVIDHNVTIDTQLVANNGDSYHLYDLKGNVFLISDQKTLSFNNADNTAYLKTIGGNTQIIFEGSSGGFGGKLIAESGNNEFTFENTGTFSFSTTNLIANNSSQNIFTIDKNITINSDMTLSGNASSSGGNIFNISTGKTLSFKNGSTPTTLITNGGFSHLLLSGSGAFEGNINTTEGNAQLSFNGSGGTLSGNIQTDGGKTLLSLSSNTTSLTLNSTFTANSSGINQLNFSNTSPLTIMSENGLVLNGNATYESGGGNILTKSTPQFLSLQNSQGVKQAITTQSGITKIDSISFEGNIQTLGGITLFSDLDNNINFKPSIKGNVIANGGNNIVLNIGTDQVQQWLAYGNSKNIFYSSDYISITSGKYDENDGFGMTNILGGDNNDGGNIFYIDNNATIFLGYDPSGASIKTIGGLTQIIFAGESGSLGGSVVADGGNNEIIFKQSGSFHLEEIFWAKGTSTNTIQIQKNASISTKILKTDNSDGGNIINIGDGAKLTITDGSIYANSSSYSGRFLISTGGGKNILRFEGASGGFSGDIIASGADNDISFSQSGTFDISGGGSSTSYYKNAIFLAIDHGNNFLIENHSITISTTLSAFSEWNASNSFVIGDGGSLNFSNGREKTSLVLTGSGKTNIEFDNYGSLSANIQIQTGTNTLYFKNSNKGVSPYAILDTSFEATDYGTNIISIDTNGTILKSNNGLQFSSSQGGKNRVELLGNGVSLTLQNVSDSQIQTLNSNGASEVYFVGENQTFNGNILSLSGISTITLGGVDDSSNDIVGKATINGNITGNGGNNAFIFLHDSSTLSMGASSQIIANSTSTNTFTIDKNITFLTDLTLSGNATGNGGNIFNISSGKNLVLQDSSSVIKTLYTTGGQSKITFEGSGNLVANLSTSGGQTYVAFGGENTSISNTKDIQATQNGANTLTFSGGVETGAISSSGKGSNTLTINGVATLGDINSSGGSNEITLNGGGTLGNVVANGGSNIINLGANISTLSLTSGKSINATQGSNTINVLSQNLTLSGTITSSSGQNHINLNTSGGNLNLTKATFSTSSAKNNHIHLKNSGTFIITMDSTNTNHLAFDLDSEGAKLNFGGDLSTIGTAINFNANNTTLISNITTTAGTTTLTLNTPKSRDTWKEMSAYIEGKITTVKGAETNLVFSSSNQRLILEDDAQITDITHQANNGISFYHTSRSSTDFKTLTIGSKDSTTSGISGNGLNFLVYAISNTPNASLETQPSGRITQGDTSKAYADKIVIHSSSNEGASTHNLGVVFENQDSINLDAISYTKGADNNILIASVSNNSQVSFNAQSTCILGFDVAQIDYVTESTDENGNISGSGYTSYFVGKAKATEVVVAEQEITATAFTLNYDLYMANLNSLNKRMGELRENAHSQGVWTRVFNGALSNDFGLGSKSNYTTIQTGYDYAFGFEGANNYLGVALSYALSTSTSQNAFDENGQRRGIDGIYSNAVEVALYNSYVSDSGWYNDSIAKFSYLMSSFDIANSNSNTTTSNNTTNFALTLGDEVGYVFKLGENKEWSITPQIEATFGYFSQSDFKQTLANSNIYLDSMAENVLTLRARAGSAFAYDFKNFTQKDSFNASLYIGAFYEYDYVSGGEIKMSTQRETQTNKYSNLSSDGRAVMNVGTNMSIQDHTRLYFDFEKSFAGKITTDYQVNFGVRYSFGESNGYTPMIEKTESKAPLKVEEEENKEAEETTDKTQENNEIKEEKKETETKEDSTPQK